MEPSIAENYHKILCRLIVAGDEVVGTLAQNLAASRILSNEDLGRINEVVTVREKAEVVLKGVSLGQHTNAFYRYLEETAPGISRSFFAEVPNEENLHKISEILEDLGSTDLVQSLNFVSCEREILSEDYKAISKQMEQMSEQLARSEAESSRLFRQIEGDRQELTMLRRKILAGGAGNPVLNKMYETMLERFDILKKDHEALQKKHSEESKSRLESQQHIKLYDAQLSEFKSKYDVLFRDHDSLSRQMQNLNERNEALQRDLHRVRDERTLIKREYSLVMSERDAVHKEIQKLTDDISNLNRQLSDSIAEKKALLDDKERMLIEINSLKQNHTGHQDTSANIRSIEEKLYVVTLERKQALAQYEFQLNEAYTAQKAEKRANENLLKLQGETERLTAKIESLTIELRDANSEAKDAMRNRDMAFSEREKMRCERDEIKKTYDLLAEERERIMKQLEAEIKEHDATKEAKKKIWKELRDLQPKSNARGNVSSSSSRRDNTDSHDSAIDTCEFGSEEISTLEGGGVPRRLKTFQYKLPRQPDINLETGLFVTRSACPGITIEDRVVSINDTAVDSNNAPKLQRLVPNSNNPCVIKVMRSSSPPPTTESLNGDFGHASVDSALYTTKQSAINRNITTADAQCQTAQSPRYGGHRPSIPNSTEDESNEDTITPMIYRNIHHAQSPSTCISSGGESHISTSTHSDSVHSSQTNSLFRHPSNPSNKSSDSSASFHRNSSTRKERKKSKLWSKINGKNTRKSKTSRVSGTVTGVNSSGDAADGKTSSGGTWPRLDTSPNIPPAGRFSVFAKKPKNRPPLSSSTFTPPPPGRTPPTAIKSLSADATPKSVQDILQPISQPLRPTPGPTKRPRPISVPIDTGPSLTLWKEPMNASNNNNSLSPQHPTTPKSAAIVEIFQELKTSSQQNSVVNGISYSSNNGLTTNTLSDSNHFSFAVAAGDPITKPGHLSYMKPRFIRQQSTPPEKSPDSVTHRQISRPVQRSRHVTSPNPNLQPRSAQSLPRPTSGKSSSRTSSIQSIVDPSTQIRTKSLDYRRIRIPSEKSVMKWSGSERGSSNLSDRSTPTLFHHGRTSSPAPPYQSTPAIHPPSTPLQYSLMSPPFHPSSTPLIPSPPSLIPSSPSTCLLDSSVPYIPGSTLSSLSNVSTSFKSRRPPIPTDPRYVYMVKGIHPIGISIVGGGAKGGIFVSRINEDSLAARAGLEYGDQLLEYNGINLRSASEEQGRAIMSQAQAGDSITFLAQYNLEKYRSSIESNLSGSIGLMKGPKHLSPLMSFDDKEGTITPDTTPRSSPQPADPIRAQPIGQPRHIFLPNGCDNVVLAGGNYTGIFIESVDDKGDESSAGLKTGDQILECNNVDLRNATLERASLLFSKSTDKSISISVYYNNVGYSKLTESPGDFFYVRSLFDNLVEPSTGSLPFTKNSILLIDNTYPDRTMGTWSAWLVDEHGEKTAHGKIPSKFTVEKDNWVQRDLDDSVSYAGSTAGKKLSGTGRRSFFRRRKPHRNSSRSSGEVKIYKSVSETSIESTETNFEHVGAAYQVVDKHVSQFHRPVVVFGPHSNSVCERLTKEHAKSFTRCRLDILHSSADLHDQNIIETFKQSGSTQALTITTLKSEMENHRHVLLEVSQDAVDRLHSSKIYPIIVFIEYSSAKKVKENQDRVPGKDKLSMKQCKEIFERSNSIRRKLSTKYLGAVYINGTSTTSVANKISNVVDREQRKVLWLPATNDLLNY